MVSVIYFARNLNYTDMQPGSATSLAFISDKTLQNMKLVYKGMEEMKGNDKKNYNCYVLSLVSTDKAFKDKESMKIYISADANRLPVRIDSGLKVGTMRVFISGSQGLRN
jgi:hypothetical protein